MRNIALCASTGPRPRSNFATRAMTSISNASNSSRNRSYAGLFQANQGRLLFCSRPPRNSIRALRCMRPTRSTADVAHLDLRKRRRVLRPDLRIAVRALVPDRGQIVADLRVAAATAHERTQFVTRRGEQAGVELAVGGQSRTRALAAERLRHRRDDADLAAAVHITPALRDFAGVVRFGRREREFAADHADDFG